MSSVVPQDFSKAKVESIFSLSPIQEGMLFHLLYEPSAGLYLNQLHYRLEGIVRPDCLQKAWQRVIDWQPTLRTLFLWENRKKPAQVVRTEAKLPWLELDWSAFSKNDQAEKLEAFLKEDRKQGFDLKRAPLMRVTIIRLAEQSFHVVWSHHHLILDGWAGSLLNEAVFKAYVSYCENRVPEFPAAVSYKNYVNWLLEQDSAAAECYWKEQLKSFNTPTRINSARPLLATPGKSFESVELSLSASETEEFHSTARTARVTPSILCQAAWGLILHRYADEDDVVFGVTVAGRSQEAQALQELIGLTINTVPVRLKIEGSCLLGNWVQLLLQQQIAREKYSWSPLSDITRWSEVKGSASLFETVLVFENFPRQEQLIHDSNGLKVGAVQAIERTNYPVTVVIEPGNQLHIQIVFDQAKFTRELASQIISDFKHNLISASNKLNLPLLKWDLPSDLVPPVLIVPAQRPSKWDKAHGVHEHFEANAQLYAARHAVHMAGERDGVLSHTYAALDRRANQVASLLRKNGIDRGCFVGLFFQRSVEMVVAMLAVLKAGAAYVPLDPSYPVARVEFMLKDSRVKVLLTHRAAGQIGAFPSVIDLDADAELISKQSDVAIQGLNIQPEDAAYVIYTSGSTGKPKGVIVTHGNITRLFRSTDHWFCFCPDDVWTLFHSYAFDFSVWEIWGALLYGGRLVVVPFLESRTPEDFYRIVKKERVTVLNQTPSAFRQLSQVDEQFNEKQLALRWVIFGGEALELQTLAGWFGRHGDMTPQLVNMYGITETTVHVTFRVIRARDLDSKSSLIGEPIPDLDIILTDKHQRLIPNGVAGEISVRGAGLARGYLDRPELTAERFIPNPWGPSGSRLYRSGDLARRLPNGDLEYLGRIDHQVKIRGHRIETGEIESVLSRHPQVRDQAVLVTKSKIGSEGSSQNQLVAYVVPRETEPSLSELRQFISKYLPDYMLPASFVFLGVLPLTENGKLNRAALPSPESLGQNSRESYVAPRNGEEEVMAGIWSEVLGLDRVGAFDNYFELGGDSIKSLWLMGRCKQVGLHFSLQELFSHPTVAELCRRIVKSNSLENSDQPSRAFATLLPPDLDMIPPDVEDAYPLSALQAGMIFHSSISPELSHYHNVSSFHLKAPFDKIHFRLALDEVSQKHPVLRTSFEMTRFKQPLQLVHKQTCIPFDVVDLSGISFEKQEVQIKVFVDAERKKPFSLSIAPLLRFCAHIRNSTSFQLTLTEHHAIVDGWSVATLLTEIFGEYFSRLGKAEKKVSQPMGLLFRDFIAKEQAISALPEAGAFWSEQINGAVFNQLPRFASPVSNAEGVVEVIISPALSAALKALAKQASVPLKSVLLAAHLRVIETVSAQREVVTGLVCNGRFESGDGENVLGLFLNTVPFRLRQKTGTWLELAQEVFRIEREILPFRRFPLSAIQAMEGGRALFETSFNFTYFHVYNGLLKLPGLEVVGGHFFERTNFTLGADFSIDLFSNEVKLMLDFDESQLDETQVRDLGECYQRVLSAMAFEPQSPTHPFCILGNSQLEKLTRRATSNEPALVNGDYIPSLFAQQAKRTPNHRALVLRQGRMTYEELNTAVQKVCAGLKGLGVTRETLVGVCLPRSMQSIVVLLGIMRAGAVYVPFDFDGPRSRLLKTIEISRMKYLVTNAQNGGDWPVNLQVIDYQSFEQEQVFNEECEIFGQQAAYIIFTSGSTGEPKGVVVSHDALRSHCLDMKSRYDLKSTDAVLQMASFTFDASLEQIFPTLTSGATLVVRGPELWSMADITSQIQNSGVSVAEFPPALLHQWLEHLNGNLDLVSSLRLVIVGGDLLTTGVTAEWKKLGLNEKVRLVNTYGPTEGTITATMCDILPNPNQLEPEISIGSPISNTQIYILANDGERAPIGTPGELFIGGIGVARGYVNQSALTADRFVPDPFSVMPGARLYRTGDLARYLPDGRIEFLGRLDNQVKIRGFRIELGEIESVLRNHHGVDQAVASIRALADNTPQLVCHWTSRGEKVNSENLRNWCRAHLPDYMVPAHFCWLSNFELTTNGKVDRSRLPVIAEAQPTKKWEWSSAGERDIAAIWQDVLGHQAASPEDNFFSVGGHSLLLIRLHGKLQSKVGRDFPLMDLFQHTTIRSQSEYLQQNERPKEDLEKKIQNRASLQKMGLRQQLAARQRTGIADE